jgi:HK97 gp10 family phage protein
MPMIGAKKHIARLKRLQGREAVRLVGQALFAGGEAIQVEAQRLISTGSVSGKNHVPSAPGQPPNYDSGVLSSNIETIQVEPLRVQVRSNAPYASALEFGTSKMAERPYMRPARDNKRAEVVAKVQAAVAVAVRRSG